MPDLNQNDLQPWPLDLPQTTHAAIPLPATLPLTVRLSTPPDLTDEQCDALLKAHTWFNGSHAMTDHRKMIRAALALAWSDR